MLGFALGYAAGKGGRGADDIGETFGCLFVIIIFVMIIALIVTGVNAIIDWKTSEPIQYETVITNTEHVREGTNADYLIYFENSLGEEICVDLNSYKEFQKYEIGDEIIVEANIYGRKKNKENEQKIKGLVK